MADNAQECLIILAKELLGEGYYIASPVGGAQANEIITNDLIYKYKKTKLKDRLKKTLLERITNW